MSAVSLLQIKVAGAAGAFIILTGALFLGFWPKLFDFVLNKQLVLSEDSYSNNLWEETPIPVYIEFYFFNWTNSEDIYNTDPNIQKPNLTQLGPYVFKEQRKKIVLSWNEDNNTVTFLQNKTWHYEPSLSKGSLDDLVTTVNIPAIAAAFAVRNYPLWIKSLLNRAMLTFDSKLAVTKKVSEFLFDGYSDPLIDLASLVPGGLLPVTIPFDKFGWFYTRNGSETYDGVFNMFTGKGDIKKFGKLAEWNYENPTSAFNSSCGALNGSAGEFFLPHPEKGGTISLFSPDICRMINLNYKEEVTIERIKGYRYWGDEHVFDNVSRKPETWCYCPSGECAPNGAIDVSTCKWGAPAFITFPHFFNADPHFRRSVNGMEPDESLHQMYVDLEQHTGIPLQVAASLQINILLQNFTEYRMFDQVPKVYFPIIWFKERARIDDEIGPQVRLVSRLPIAGYVIFGMLLCIGLFTVFIIGAFYFFNFKRQRHSETDLRLVGT